MTELSLEKLTLFAIEASLKAGEAILKHYYGSYSIEYKEDSSPLTSADKEAHEIISNVLSKSDLPVLSEEGKDISFDHREKWDRFWLVDPLDGTKEFINGNGEFTVNVALIDKGVPIVGVVLVPVNNILYFGNSLSGSFRMVTPLKAALTDYPELLRRSYQLPLYSLPKLTILGSRSHLTSQTAHIIQLLINKYGDVDIINAGSSLKFCKIAEGTADIYPRLGPTMEWDTAAGHAVCKYASVNVLDYYSKSELIYNKPDLLNPWFIVYRAGAIDITDIMNDL